MWKTDSNMASQREDEMMDGVAVCIFTAVIVCESNSEHVCPFKTELS